MNKMIYNYHTHTHRCRHAEGVEEDYIKKAIEGGIKYMGFSDHIPLKLEDGTESEYRVPVSEGKAYCDTIKTLREKYKDKIDIKVGFECEYYPEFFDKMLQNAIEYGAEYLILGHHFLKPENLVSGSNLEPTDDVNNLKTYVASVIEAMDRNVFTYIAHPDFFNFSGDVKVFQEEMRKLCIESRKRNVPLELNFLGIRTGRIYPNPAFWQVVGEEQAPVVFGFDAHTADHAFDSVSLIKAKEMVKKYNLNYIGVPKLIPIQQ